jgi:hypothetical protein
MNAVAGSDSDSNQLSDGPQENNLESDSAPQQLHPSDTLIGELSSLRDATRKAIAESYREKERLCRDGEIMQVSHLMCTCSLTIC